MLSRIRSSIAARSSGVSGRGSSEVVVEAVVDGRPDAELGAREQVQDRLGHDVRGRVAHRVELAAGAGVEQLVGRAALGRLEADLRLDRVARSQPRRCLASRPSPRPPPENHETPRPSTGREASSRGPTRLRHRIGGALAGRANGRLPGRFAGHSRVVPMRRRSSGFQPRPGSLAIRSARRVPLDALVGRPVAGRCGGRHWTRTSDLLHVKQVL